MSFRRTSLGLRNQPTFFGSDLVVYVEGRNLTEAKIAQENDGAAVTQDSLFWSGVIGKLLPGVRLHFKALGSKTELAKFSSGLDDQVRGKLLICVDRDFDGLLPRNVALNFVVPSYRYSWEADIWMWVVFVEVLTGLLPAASVPLAALRSSRRARDQFFREAKKLVRLDVQTAVTDGLDCFLPREQPSAIVDVGGRFPRINKRYFRARARTFREALPRPWRPGFANGVNHKRYLFGKAVDRFHCQLLVALLRALGFPATVPFYVFQNAAIRHLPLALDHEQRVAQLEHYERYLRAAI